MHQMAEPAALAAIAAQNQGKFWQMHDALFAAGTLTKESIEQKLYKDMTDAKHADIASTPTLFINGHRVKDRGPQAIQELINRELEARK